MHVQHGVGGLGLLIYFRIEHGDDSLSRCLGALGLVFIGLVTTVHPGSRL